MSATGFLGAGAFPTQLTEAEFESARYEELNDMTATTGSAFLGLSVGCARCHDHKFDPIPAEDYYRIASAFTNTIRSEIELAIEPGQKPTKVQVTAEGFPHTKHHADDRGFPHFYPKTFVLNRGDVNQKKREASPGFLRVLMRDGRDESSWRVEPPAGWSKSDFRRASLARWLTDPELGGAGDLGREGRGQPALAAPLRPGDRRHAQRLRSPGVAAEPSRTARIPGRNELIRGGWRLKPIHKLMVASAVYHAGHDRIRRGPRRDRPRERRPLADGTEAARSRADPRRDAQGRRPARRADVRPRDVGRVDATTERLLLRQAEPTGPRR